MDGVSQKQYIADYHVHIERGPYTFEWLDQFIQTAQLRGIAEIGIVEHSHRFQEFAFLYDSMIQDDTELGQYQKDWLAKRLNQVTFNQYQKFITAARKKGYPIKMGLEICYLPGYDQQIRELIDQLSPDFVIGSLHWVDGWGFDHSTTNPGWAKWTTQELQKRYNELLIEAIHSNLFQIIGHIDSIKGFSPWDVQSWISDQVLAELKKSQVCIEVNSGLKHRGIYVEGCPSETFLRKCYAEKIMITLSSDAHEPGAVGELFEETLPMIKEIGYNQFATFQNRQRRLVSLG